MKKSQVIEIVKQTKIIPVIRTASTDAAKIIIRALIEGGINVLEVTMTVPRAADLIAELTVEYKKNAVIGAGTVLDAATAEKCVAAGAKFIVSPICDLETVAFCHRNETVVMPGALTPNEIFAASRAGADLVKVFPASALGGAAYIKAVKAVFPDIEMIPTGGIEIAKAVEYLKAGACAVGMGGELTKGDASNIIAAARRLQNEIGKVK